MTKKSTVKQYPIKMPPSLWDKLENVAKDQRRSVNQTIILAIEKYLERTGMDIKFTPPSSTHF